MKYLIILLLLSSCVTQKQRTKICNECKIVEIYKDSIYLKDTVVKIESDSASYEALLECDSLGNVRILEFNIVNGKYIALQTSLKNNRFKTTAKTDTIQIHVPGVKQFVYRTKIEKIPVVKYKEHWWKWPLIIWFILTFPFVIWKTRKLF
jgi:hypothetical protein